MNSNDHKIALISYSGQFPGAENVDTLWQNSISGTVSLQHFNRETLLKEGVAAEELDDPSYVPVKGFLDKSTYFDAYLFDFSPAESTVIDPQQRLFLEHCLAALELGALDPARFEGQIGVYAGQFISTYLLNVLSLARRNFEQGLELATVFQGNTVDQLAARVAYKLDLHGPAVTVQTACSTSLVAVYQACEALKNYECDAVLAGGAAVSFPAKSGYLYTPGGIFSKTGRCRPFDAGADGTVFGDGVGVVLLKRLDDAIANGDPIKAVILACALNNDGHRKVSYSAPSVAGQIEVLSEALELSGVSDKTVGYIETHGTGTFIGDVVEMEALQAVYSSSDHCQPLFIGAVKANIGHLEAAAGIAGLIKAAKVIETGKIPPLAGFSSLNPEFQLENSRFVFPTEPQVWKNDGQLRRAGVSAFGVGGTNAHLILEEFQPESTPEPSEKRIRIFPFSAKTVPALKQIYRQINRSLSYKDDLQAVQTTVALGRMQRSFRSVVIAEEREELTAQLEQEPSAEQISGERAEVVFVMTASGLSSVNRGQSLFEKEPVFRARFDALSKTYGSLTGNDPEHLLSRRQPTDGFAVNFSKNLIWSLALAGWLNEMGIVADSMLGHGFGEFPAAVLSGVISAEKAVSLTSELERIFAERETAERLVFETESEKEQWRCHLKGLSPQEPRLAFYSTLLAEAAEKSSDLSAEHWIRLFSENALFGLDAFPSPAGNRKIYIEIGGNGVFRKFTSESKYDKQSDSHIEFMPFDGEKDFHRTVLQSLGRLWQIGLPLNWEMLGGVGGQRLSLPAYPFQKQEYVLKTTDENTPDRKTKADNRKEQWLKAPLFREIKTGTQSLIAGKRRRWLLCLPSPESHRQLIGHLEKSGQVVTVVMPGERLARLGRGNYSLRPTVHEDYVQLLQELKTLVRTPNVVIFGLGTGGNSETAVLLESLTGLINGLRQDGLSNSIRLGILTENAFDSLGNENLSPSNAALGALALSIGQEESFLELRHIDLCDAGQSDPEAASIITEYILGENTMPAALRGRKLFERCLTVVEPLKEDASGIFGQEGFFVVTGGSGGLGSLLARGLVEKYGATVLSVSRRQPPGTAKSAFADGGFVSQDGMNSDGKGGIFTATADVGNEQDFSRILQLGGEKWGALLGIIHAAGVVGGKLVSEETKDGFEVVLHPKLKGAESIAATINRLQLNEQIKFVALCSSTAALVGGHQQGSYAAANAALDAFALARRDSKSPLWVSINWDTIADTGMAKTTGESPNLSRLSSLRTAYSLKPEDCAELFYRALALRTGQVVITRLPATDFADLNRELKDAFSPVSRQKGERPPLGTVFEEPRTELESQLAEIWSDLFGIKEVGIHDGFIDLGGDSILVAQLAARLRRKYEINLPIAVFFNSDTIAKLALEIENAILSELD